MQAIAPGLKRFLTVANMLHPSVRICAYVQQFNMVRVDDDTAGILKNFNAVIPGLTRYSCKACGECCRSPNLIQLPEELYDPKTKGCKYQKDNLCTIDETKSWFCKLFPYRLIDLEGNFILFINFNCRGVDIEAPVIDDARYIQLVEEIKTSTEMFFTQTRDI